MHPIDLYCMRTARHVQIVRLWTGRFRYGSTKSRAKTSRFIFIAAVNVWYLMYFPNQHTIYVFIFYSYCITHFPYLLVWMQPSIYLFVISIQFDFGIPAAFMQSIVNKYAVKYSLTRDHDFVYFWYVQAHLGRYRHKPKKKPETNCG